MKKIFSVLAMTVAVTLGGVSFSYAVPSLQLDIEGGIYDPVTETIMATSNVFNLYALSNADTLPQEVFYISAAIVPKVATPATLGSFTFNGEIIDVTADMTYGTPPIATVDNDLASHGIFETYFAEFSFQFDETKRALEYNTADNPGGTLGGLDFGGSEGYYASFMVDVTSVGAGYAVHFDLYTYGDLPGANNKTGITDFAPFSHDAQSQSQVPEPATMLLFGAGLMGLAGIARKKRS